MAYFVVEGKTGGAVAADARFGKLREDLADFVEKLSVSGGAGARGFSDGGLIDLKTVFDVLETAGGLVGFWETFAWAAGSCRHGEAATHEG